MVGEVSAGVARVPLAARFPLHAPPALQPVALVELQARVELPPLAMAEGLAFKVTVGTMCTVTLEAALVPPGPLQTIE